MRESQLSQEFLVFHEKSVSVSLQCPVFSGCGPGEYGTMYKPVVNGAAYIVKRSVSHSPELYTVASLCPCRIKGFFSFVLIRILY